MLRASTLALFTTLLASLGGCTAVEWQPRAAELPDRWRDHRLFVSEQAYVLATSEAAAAEVHELVTAARPRLVAEIDSEPGRPLIIALSFDDPLPITDPEDYGRALREWRQTVLGVPTGGTRIGFPIGSRMQMGPDGETVEVDPAIPLHMIGTPIPGDDPRLALPPALVAAARGVTLLPTASCLEAGTDAMIDIALEAQGISRFTYAAVALIVGDPADKLTAKATHAALTTLEQTWAAAHGKSLAPRPEPDDDIPTPVPAASFAPSAGAGR